MPKSATILLHPSLSRQALPSQIPLSLPDASQQAGTRGLSLGTWDCFFPWGCLGLTPDPGCGALLDTVPSGCQVCPGLGAVLAACSLQDSKPHQPTPRTSATLFLINGKPSRL